MFHGDFHNRLFTRFDGIRIAWPFFMHGLPSRQKAIAANGPCLTRTEILDLFADEFCGHTGAPKKPGRRAGRYPKIGQERLSA